MAVGGSCWRQLLYRFCRARTTGCVAPSSRWTTPIRSGKFWPFPARRSVGFAAGKMTPAKPAAETPAMPFPRASKALARFTVLDLTRVRSGPTCVRQLADWGANVIKIETPPGLEEPMGGPREGGDFQNLHRNKRSMTLNLKAPEGLATFK